MLIQWSTFECVTNPSFIIFHRCFIIEPGKNLITAEFEYNQPIQQYNASFVVYLPRPPFNEFSKHFEIELDFCEFIQGAYKNKLVGTVYKTLLKFGNMPKRCPQAKVSNGKNSEAVSIRYFLYSYTIVFKGLLYYRNMSIADNLPAFLPKYRIKVELDFYMPQTPLINITLIGRLAYPTKHKV
ncbi:hypothetical protein KR044_002616 [Drosophila immigrans]|nr:hypothetical protein KR044_002616 [Drosophila immigrans]